MNRFPHDDVIKSMVALSQLIKRLLRNHHIYQQELKVNLSKSSSKTPHTTIQADSNNQQILSRLFYLLIDLYEAQMHHSNDILNSISQSSNGDSSTKTGDLNSDYSLLIQTTSGLNSKNFDQSLGADPVHSYIFDLIHLIGTNFIQTSTNPSNELLRKRNQQILIEKIIQKLTSTINIQSLDSIGRNLSTGSGLSSSSQSSARRTNNIILNLTRNKLSLMSLCAQYVEPNDLDLFNEFYSNILNSVTSILLTFNTAQTSEQSTIDPTEIINLKLSIILQLLSKFSFTNLNTLLKSYLDSDIVQICSKFVETNIKFLADLKLEQIVNPNNPNPLNNEPSNELKNPFNNEKNLKQIVDQCIDNFTWVLNVNYPFYFEYLLKKCLEFSSKSSNLKYGHRHLSQLNIILQQNEILCLSGGDSSKKLAQDKFEKTFKFLNEYFHFERNKHRTTQKSSLYSHWCIYTKQISDLYTILFTLYLDRFLIKDLADNFEKRFKSLWSTLLDLYQAWIEPMSIKDVTSQNMINPRDTYKNLASGGQITTSTAVLVMIDSFFSLVNVILDKLLLIEDRVKNARNFLLNTFFHYFYEQVTCSLNSSSTVDDNTMDCYFVCLVKYSWFERGLFEPDYKSINIMNEMSLGYNEQMLHYLAFDLVAHLDLAKICENYFRKAEIMPIQINDLLKVIKFSFLCKYL